jgi:hypothetical protein
MRIHVRQRDHDRPGWLDNGCGVERATDHRLFLRGGPHIDTLGVLDVAYFRQIGGYNPDPHFMHSMITRSSIGWRGWTRSSRSCRLLPVDIVSIA